jgi:hypothetical protein
MACAPWEDDMDALDTGPTLLGLEDAAGRLGTTRRTVERLIARGDLTVKVVALTDGRQAVQIPSGRPR